MIRGETGDIEGYCQDITEIVQLQQIKSDKLYKNAIQANFSHEYLTPLNSILSNSRILLQELKKIEEFKRNNEENYTSLLWMMKNFIDMSAELNK